MKIQKVEIKGLFGKKDIEWELNPQVNVLVGENGSGKSTILLLIYSFLTQTISDNTKNIINNASIHLPNGEIRLEIKETLLDLIKRDLGKEKFLNFMNNEPNLYKKIKDMRDEKFIGFVVSSTFVVVKFF